MTLDEYRPPLRGSVTVGRKVGMPNYGSLNLEYTEEFYLDQSTHEVEADKLVERVRAKLAEWGAVK